MNLLTSVSNLVAKRGWNRNLWIMNHLDGHHHQDNILPPWNTSPITSFDCIARTCIHLSLNHLWILSNYPIIHLVGHLPHRRIERGRSEFRSMITFSELTEVLSHMLYRVDKAGRPLSPPGSSWLSMRRMLLDPGLGFAAAAPELDGHTQTGGNGRENLRFVLDDCPRITSPLMPGHGIWWTGRWVAGSFDEIVVAYANRNEQSANNWRQEYRRYSNFLSSKNNNSSTWPEMYWR